MSLMKKAIGGSIHRIREFELEKVNLADEFDILQIVGEGWFGKILLTEHRSTQTEMVLKALPKAYTGVTDFYREFHYGLHLSAHRNIITTYDVAFETAGFYIFSQEYAPLGDLTSNVTETGLGELHAKRVARQLAAAVHHIHSRELVHRDIKLDNILVFRSDFSRIKLCDFGETRRANTIVRRHNEWLPYSPPEVLQIDTDETYKALTSHDVWQFGIVLFVCLTGCIPWQKAAMDDRRYTRYLNWHTATLNIAKKPKLFQFISSRAQRMFKRLLEPKLEKRPVSVLEINKYLEDRWLAKLGAEKALNGGADERDELSPSMYSFHSSLEEKNQLLYTLTQYGIETTVDRTRKKDRIREWIESSAIAEENEDEESDLDEAERLNGNSEIDEDARMKGRHYPERRPSSRTTKETAAIASPVETIATAAPPATNERTNVESPSEIDDRKRTSLASGKTRRANTILSSNHRAARSLRRTERRNPFAPQVAQERNAVARFASFPNGDPNLAITNDRATILTENAVKLANFEREQSSLRSNDRTNDGIVVDSMKNRSFNISSDFIIEGDSTRNSPLRKIVNGASVVEKTQGYATSIEGDGFKNGISDRRESYEEERTMSRNPPIPVRKNRSLTAPSAILPRQLRMSDYEAEAVVASARGAIGPPAAPRAASEPTIVPPPSNFVNNNNINANNNNNSSNSSNSSNNNNPLTMSVASHLVMQSFNALQSMNTVPLINKTTNDKHSYGNKVTGNYEREKSTSILGYGKDAYEHYGIAQKAVSGARNDLTRQGSSGSGSRSVSN